LKGYFKSGSAYSEANALPSAPETDRLRTKGIAGTKVDFIHSRVTYTKEELTAPKDGLMRIL
jgi:hypothetical protein